MNTAVDTHPTAGGGELSSPPPAVAFNNLHVSWNSSVILHGITAAIPTGQTVAITGSNGSGKSTLVRALMNNAPITGGSVKLLGTNLARPQHVDWSRIGYVPQRMSAPSGISSTVEEVVRSGLLGAGRLLRRRTDKARTLEALEQVGLAHRAKDPIHILSGGQHQRALIARALVRKPDLLVMDEPMAGIDAHSRQRLSSILGSLRTANRTILLVLHELGELSQHLDRELHLRNGHILYDGPVHDHETHLHAHSTHDPHMSQDITHNAGRQHIYSAGTLAHGLFNGEDQ